MHQDDENREEVHIGHGPRIRIGRVNIGLEGILGLVAILIVGAVALSLIFTANRGGASSAPAPTANIAPPPAAPTAMPTPVLPAAALPLPGTPAPTVAPVATGSASTEMPVPTIVPTASPAPSPTPLPAATSLANLSGARYPWPAVTAPDRVLLELDANGLRSRSPAVVIVFDDGGQAAELSGTTGIQIGDSINLAVRIRFKTITGPGLSVGLRSSQSDQYQVNMDPDDRRVHFGKRSGGVYNRLVESPSVPLSRNQWHDLEIRMVNDTAAILLDGSLILFVRDPDPISAGRAFVSANVGVPTTFRVSHIQVVEISSIETAGAALAALTGKLLFAGEPVIRVTKAPPLFELRPRQPGQPCPQAQTRIEVVEPAYNPATGEYTLANVQPGDYCLWAWFDSAEPFDGQKGRAGDLHSEFSGAGRELSLARGATALDIPFHRVIHLVRPVDNRGEVRMGPECCDVLRSPVQVAWEAVPGSVRYDVNVLRCPAGDCARGGQVARRSMQQDALEVVLPPSDPNEHYFLYIEALDNRGRRLASLATGTSFRGWSGGYQFRIETTALPTPTPTPTASPVQLSLFKPEINGLAVIISGAVGPVDAVARLRWDWGDGIPYDAGFPQSHVYAQAGTYTVKVTAYDRVGRVLASRSVAISLPSQ